MRGPTAAADRVTQARPAATRPATRDGGQASAASSRQLALLLVLAGNMLIDAVEVAALVVAAPSVAVALHAGVRSAQWTISGFCVGFGGTLLLGARLVEAFGRRRVYLLGLAGFAVASVVAALTPTLGLLTLTRLVKGACAALTAPTGLAIVGSSFRAGPERDRAVAVYAFFGASGFAVGLVVAGALTDISWRWALAFPAPVVAALLVLAARLVPAEPPARQRTRRDITGAVALLGALATLCLGIVSAPDGPLARGLPWFAAALLLLLAFVAAQRSATRPLVRGRLLRHRRLRRAALGAATLNGSYLGLLLVVTFQVQQQRGWGPLATAAALLPAALPLVLTVLWSGRLARRYGTARLVALGSVAPPVGYALAAWHGSLDSYAGDLLPTLLLVACGFVLAFAALNLQALAGVDPADRAMAGALYQTAVQVGGALTVASVAALLGWAGAVARPGPAVASAYRPALLLVTAVGLVGSLVATTGLRADARRSG